MTEQRSYPHGREPSGDRSRGEDVPGSAEAAHPAGPAGRMSDAPRPRGEVPAQSPPKVTYSKSRGFVRLLAKLECAVAVSSYQSRLLYHLGRNAGGGLHVHQCVLPAAMGISYRQDGGLTLATNNQIVRFENILEPGQRINGTFDACFLPRRIHMTGDLAIHDVGVGDDGQVFFVNTSFNCLATTCDRHSFVPVWRPPFIDALVNEDRCHLNGLAMRDGRPAYVTAVSRSNTIDGWRDRRDGGGVVIDVATNRVVCEGLSMPHSPRWHDGQLWLLNSGTGELGVVAGLDGGTGRFEPRAFCPGFLRGLAFHEGHAFVGLSKPRHQRFEGLPLDARLAAADSEAWCGLQVIDLASGACAEWFRIDGDVTELYDVAILPGIANPMALSPAGNDWATLVTWQDGPEHLQAIG